MECGPRTPLGRAGVAVSDDTRKVGYRNPPEDTRWKPGQSGNPSGRPRKSVRLIEVFLEEANAPITISENGQTREVAKLHAMVKSLMARAIQGDNKAATLFLKYWNPTDIAAHEWHEKQKHKQLVEAITSTRAHIARLRDNPQDSATPPLTLGPDPYWEEYLVVSAAAEQEGKSLTWDEFLASKGVPEQFIGD